MKFKVGDKVRQINFGRNTHPDDINKIAVVVEVGGNYLGIGDGIKIKILEKFRHESDGWRGEEHFEIIKQEEKKMELKEINKDNLKEAQRQYKDEKANEEIEFAKKELRAITDEKNRIIREIKVRQEQIAELDKKLEVLK